MIKQTIAVLYGGKTGEHEVSKISAASVVRNCDRSRFDLLLIGIDEQGFWHLQGDDVLPRVLDGEDMPIEPGLQVFGTPGGGLYAASKQLNVDCVFPVLHGTNGEDGTVQGFLETLNTPYVGAGILASAAAMDKIKAKQIWASEGIPVVPFKSIRYDRFDAVDDKDAFAVELYHEWAGELGEHLFIKPCRAGSSVGISKVHNAEEMLPALELAFRFDSLLLIEKSVESREIECSVLGNIDISAFPPGEVISHHEFYDYAGKYLDPEGASFAIPADLPGDTNSRIMEWAVKAFRALEGEGLARVDFFVSKADGSVYINEVNTMPGFTNISMYPKMCAAGGLAYADLLSSLVDLAFDRHRQRQRLDLHFDAASSPGMG
jgi:D-alanine-D-alanine ligase